jgi:hypothetical protein
MNSFPALSVCAVISMFEVIGSRAIYVFGEGYAPEFLSFLEFSLHSFSTTFAFIVGRCTLMRYQKFTQVGLDDRTPSAPPSDIVYSRGLGRVIWCSFLRIVR